MEPLGKVCDRSVGTSELLQYAAPGRIRERGERGIKAGSQILNHTVQYVAHRLGIRKNVARSPRDAAPHSPGAYALCRYMCELYCSASTSLLRPHEGNDQSLHLNLSPNHVP